MRHRLSGRLLGRKTSHRKALIRNQVTDLLRHDRIVTTEAKAKAVRPIAERVITLGKRGDGPARRRAGAVLTDKRVLRRLFDDVAPRFQDRPGGYTRIVKLGPRLGDGARMAQLELVEGSGVPAIMDAAAAAAPEPETPEPETPEARAPAADVPPADGPQADAAATAPEPPQAAAPADDPPADDGAADDGDNSAANGDSAVPDPPTVDKENA